MKTKRFHGDDDDENDSYYKSKDSFLRIELPLSMVSLPHCIALFEHINFSNSYHRYNRVRSVEIYIP